MFDETTGRYPCVVLLHTSILLPICLTKRTRICFKSNNNDNNNNNNKSRPRKERKRDHRERGDTRRRTKNSLSARTRPSRIVCERFLSLLGENAEFTSPAVADTLFRRTRGRRRRKRSHERVADDTLPISRYFSTAQSEP